MNDARPPNPTRRYQEAHRMHYVSKDLEAALDLYVEILDTDLGTPEAGYASSQIENIVRSVVPAAVVLDVQVELARTHLRQRDPASTGPTTERP